MIRYIVNFDWTTLRLTMNNCWIPRKQDVIYLSPNMEEAMHKRETKKVVGGNREIVDIAKGRLKFDLRDFF